MRLLSTVFQAAEQRLSSYIAGASIRPHAVLASFRHDRRSQDTSKSRTSIQRVREIIAAQSALPPRSRIVHVGNLGGQGAPSTPQLSRMRYVGRPFGSAGSHTKNSHRDNSRICGAEFDPAARAVAAPADPTMRRLISFLSFDLHKDNSRRMEGWSNAR
jgi:hypothetical protein